MPQYIIANDPLVSLVSDSTNIPTQPEIGFDPKDKNNVAYSLYNLNYALYRFLGGFNVRLPPSFTPQLGGTLDVYIDNTTTGLPTNSKTYTLIFKAGDLQQVKIQAMVGMPDQKALGVGKLDIAGSYTDPSGSPVTVFPSTYLKQVLP